ncbi:MAG: hypothetical protein HYV60_07055 [Planctomycetia bacterium]|nr:hypothetical protein [Planctomycetia bacterium]
MATGTAKPIQPAAPMADAELFIERQLAKTRLQVRVVDLASSLMALVAAILVYTLVLAVVDHWIMPLAWWSRWLACIWLLGGVGYYLAVVVVPLMMRPINPVYAARAIEEAEPTLKNSLINFLLFKNDRGSLHQLIFSAMQQRAAADLHRVPIESAVDRSKVIYFGYLLAGVLAVCAAYAILSPKDPLQSVARVIAPWADIERPTRVKIEDVQPGDVTVFQGDTVTVSCSLVGQADSVTLFFSTIDGEIDEQPVEMKLAVDGLRFECKLPPQENGFQQAVTYRIEAGDAMSDRNRPTKGKATSRLWKGLASRFEPRRTSQSARHMSSQTTRKAKRRGCRWRLANTKHGGRSRSNWKRIARHPSTAPTSFASSPTQGARATIRSCTVSKSCPICRPRFRF